MSTTTLYDAFKGAPLALPRLAKRAKVRTRKVVGRQAGGSNRNREIEKLYPKNQITPKMEILFVGENARYFSDKLMDLGYKGIAHNNCEMAMGYMRQLDANSAYLPGAILCEYQMVKERKDNCRFFDVLRLDPRFQNIPVIIVGTDGNTISREEAVELGVDDVYTEGFEFTDLHKRIQFLQQFKQERRKLEKISRQDKNIKGSIFKRAFDIAVASALLLMLSPLLLLIALLVKLESRGPVFYVSKRAGAGYQIFDFIKFRSMRQDADAQVARLMHMNQYNKEDGAAFFKMNNDPRVTRVGKFIRKTSLDELPQLFNVIKGDMSIVGNRPLPLYEAEQLTKDKWAKRFLAPAGMTGLWQVTKRGKNDMSAHERIALDMLYADKNTFWMDIKILLMTPFAMMQKEAV